jgi:hypothetical protein
METGGIQKDVRSYAYALNNAAQVQVVGHSEFGADMHATLWQGGKAIDLNNQLPRGSTWLVEHAYGVNDAGLIVGEGQHGSGPHAVLLTPSIGKTATVTSMSTVGLGPLAGASGAAKPQPAPDLGSSPAAPTGTAASSSITLSTSGLPSDTCGLPASQLTASDRYFADLSAGMPADVLDAISAAV